MCLKYFKIVPKIFYDWAALDKFLITDTLVIDCSILPKLLCSVCFKNEYV